MVENAQSEDPYLEKQRKELVLIVDENNVEVRGATRQEMRVGKLWHRASYVFIVTDEAHGHKLLVQKRTMKKDYCPGFFDLATGGVVGYGEDDDESAQREVAEELGIPDAALEKVGVTRFDGDASKVFGNIYIMRNFNPEEIQLNLQADEVDEVVYWSKQEIEERVQNE